MRHLPIFVDLRDQQVVFAGAGAVATPKIRLLMKTEASIQVYGEAAAEEVVSWAKSGQIAWFPRPVENTDLGNARLVYIASDDAHEDARVRALAERAGTLFTHVDHLEGSRFITPAIVDRDPVMVAIGTEGTAPVLAQLIKAQIEALLSPTLGTLAGLAAKFRKQVEAATTGSGRRTFWSRFFSDAGDRALAEDGEAGIARTVHSLLNSTGGPPGRVQLVGAGPGDPELLTLKARNAIQNADVILYDRLVDPRIIELARREAKLTQVGKISGGRSWKQQDIDAAMVEHATNGRTVVRLKSGDPMVFGRADEEIDALEANDIDYEIVTGITSAMAASAAIRTSLTRRDRNSAFTLITAQDAKGYAEHDWRALAKQGSAFGIYMGVRAARFVQGRLLLHGADAQTPVTIVENVSRPNQTIVSGELNSFPELFESHGLTGPAVIFIGLAARDAYARDTGEAVDTPRYPLSTQGAR
ncbi:MAG: siroheme synthase CysG [Pseudomonadales bacterium]